jgi:hypothetical protein
MQRKYACVFDRPTLEPSTRIALTPTELARHVIGFPNVRYYRWQMVAALVCGGNEPFNVFMHVDSEYSDGYAPVQPKLDRLTAFIRHRIATSHWRQEFIFPALAMALHPRVGQDSRVHKLDMDCLKYILSIAV